MNFLNTFDCKGIKYMRYPNRNKQYHLLKLIKMFNNDSFQKMNRSICCSRIFKTNVREACVLDKRKINDIEIS